MAFHILSITVSLRGSSTSQTSGPSNMMCESTPHALYDTSIPSALLSSRLLSRQVGNTCNQNPVDFVVTAADFKMRRVTHTQELHSCSSKVVALPTSVVPCSDWLRRFSHLKTVMNCGVSSCGLSALTSATFPKSPSMLR